MKALDHIRGLLARRRWRARQAREDLRIENWLAAHGRSMTELDVGATRRRIDALARSPLISILMPVYDVEERWLEAAIDSVVAQVYENWELCIADDASPSPHVRRILEEASRRDPRIKIVFRETNGHISAASNSALELAAGEYTGLLDHDDELTRDALLHVVDVINNDPSLEMIYSDEDVIDASGRRHSPKLKPSWSRDLFYSVNYATHFAVYRTERLREAGGFRIGFEGSQDYDLALRVLELVGDERITHIPRILYHWRAIPGSVAFGAGEKPYAHERARIAIREHFARTGVSAEVTEAEFDLHRVVYADTSASVACIVSGDADALDGFPEVAPIRVADRAGAAELNSAAARCDAEVLVFIDGDLAVPDNLRELISASVQPGIGVVSGRIIDRRGIVEQAGILLRSDLTAAFAHKDFPYEVAGSIFRNTHTSNFSAISRSCMVVGRKTFGELGGFDERNYPRHLFDLDLCLRLRETGKRVVVMPHVTFVRKGKTIITKPSEEELKNFRSRWRKYADLDPFCNPNLKRDGSFGIEY